MTKLIDHVITCRCGHTGVQKFIIHAALDVKRLRDQLTATCAVCQARAALSSNPQSAIPNPQCTEPLHV